MCYFITAVLPAKMVSQSVKTIFHEHGFGYQPVSNASFQEILSAGDQQILTTPGTCDCGTVLGSASTGNTSPSARIERDLQKLRSKGWSEAKIQRWQSQREDSSHNHHHSSESERWILLIHKLLEQPQAKRIGLFLHWYSASVELEHLIISDTRKVQLSELTVDFLTHLQEDVVYAFVNDQKGWTG